MHPAADGRPRPRRQARTPEPAWHARERRRRGLDRLVLRVTAAAVRLAAHHGGAVPRILRHLLPPQASADASSTAATTPGPPPLTAAPSATSSAPAAATYLEGQRVVLHNLQAERLNGQCGIIAKWREDAGRYAVLIDGRELGIKPQNLTLSGASSCASVTAHAPREPLPISTLRATADAFVPFACAPGNWDLDLLRAPRYPASPADTPRRQPIDGPTTTSIAPAATTLVVRDTGAYAPTSPQAPNATTRDLAPTVPITGTIIKMRTIVDDELGMSYAHIGAMDYYKKKSFEELRWEDYQADRLHPSSGADVT